MPFRLFVFLCALLVLPAYAHANVKKKIKAIAPSALVLVLDEKGKELVAQRADKAFVPASVAKVVTAWLALEELGADYRFKTRLYLDDKRVLYVRGGGDPFMVSEELALMASELLAKTGKEPFSAMVLDTSYFPAKLKVPGRENTGRSYNALNSAFAANFNTINAVRRGKRVRSAEKQTPITATAISQFKARGPKKGRGRISLAQQDPAVGVRYAGELLAAFIKKSGGQIKGKITLGKVPDGLEPAYVHSQSRPLPEILSQLLIGSNNYITNQVFLEIGAHRLGAPVSLDKSLKIARKRLAALGLEKAVHLEEGSGLSRGNRFTARGLAKLLHEFAPHAELMRRTKAGSRYKTGTLSGVRTLAGFAKTQKHGMVRFVISIRGNAGRLRFSILRAIERGL
ncbi:MAG: D-alanyl-D-alanine carboxypeptidase [Pseudomonadota bacterium]